MNHIFTKKHLLKLFFVFFLSSSAFSQILRNDGQMNITSGSYMVIAGSYNNYTNGSIALDGIISVTGNWTNNSSNNIIASPGTNGEVIFKGTSTQTIGGTGALFDFEKLTVLSGSIVEVEAGKGVTAYGACSFSAPLVLKSTTTAYRPITATFINKSSVSGNITMELSYTSTGSSATKSGRGLYFSSPISNATSTIFNVAAGSNLLWYQNEATRQYVKVTANGTSLSTAKGYILRAPTSQVFNFTGTPNVASSYTNDSIPRAVIGQFYLMGNPYPAVIDWQSIVTKTNLTNTVWYQTSTIAGSMVVDTWNGNSQTGTNNNKTASVDGKIPPMQSFWVQCSAVGSTGVLTIDESVRTHNWGNSKFIKSSAHTNDRDLLRLYLYTGNKRDETIILQSESAQDNFDSWDSKKMLLKDTSRAEFYTLSPERENLVIQSIKPVTKDKTIHLGINIGRSGNYKFAANLSESLNSNNIFLEDKKEKVIQDLIANPEYPFTSDIIDDTSRFVIHLLTKPSLIVKNQVSVCSPNVVDLTDESITAGSTPELIFSYWTDATATTPFLTPTAAETGIYYIKGTAPNGSYSDPQPIGVTINPSPTVITSNPLPVTAPATVDLTNPEIILGSTLGLNYSYWLDSFATIPYATPQNATAGNYYVKGTIDATGCYSIAGPVSVIVNPSTSVSDINKNDVTIYSSQKQIHIINGEINSAISVYDILGNQIFSGFIRSNHEVVSLNSHSGIFIVKAYSNKAFISQKVYLE